MLFQYYLHFFFKKRYVILVFFWGKPLQLWSILMKKYANITLAISWVKSTLKYILIVHLFDFYINIFFYEFGHLEKFNLEQS